MFIPIKKRVSAFFVVSRNTACHNRWKQRKLKVLFGLLQTYGSHMGLFGTQELKIRE